MHGGKPGVLGVLYSSPTTATAPFVGAKLYLHSPLTRVAKFHLDNTGSVTVPIPVTGGMVGTQKNYQLIFRDLQAFLSLGVSNAVHVEFCP